MGKRIQELKMSISKNCGKTTKITYHFELWRRLWHVPRLRCPLRHTVPQLSTHPGVRVSPQCSNRRTLCNYRPTLSAFRRQKGWYGDMFPQQMTKPSMPPLFTLRASMRARNRCHKKDPVTQHVTQKFNL
jgi:hypothetical protein